MLCLLLAGCPANPPSPAPASTGGPGAAPRGDRLPAGFARGVSYAHVHRVGHGYGSAASEATLKRLRAMSVDGVALMPYGYQRRATDERIFGYPGQPGDTGFFAGVDPSMLDAHVLREIRAARRLGMKVMVKPHVWSNDYWGGGEWHGTLRQKDAAGHARWWSSYRSFALHYARLAQQGGAR